MRVSKVKLRNSSYWSNEEVRRFKLGYKRYRIYKGRPKCNLLNSINIEDAYSSLAIGIKRLVKGKTKYAL